MSVVTATRQPIALQITARSPLAFAERKPGEQFRKSLPYVPGATLFGALGHYLAEVGRFDGALLRRIRCHNAYPAQPGDGWVRPLPLTALAPKNDDQALPIDSLVARVCWEQQQPSALISLPTDDAGRAWELPSWRFYTLSGDAPVKRSIDQRVLTRVAINRQRGTAEDQRLYSPLVLNEASYDPATNTVTPSQFLGSITVEPADAALLTSLLPEITHIGGRQSTGLGAVTVERDTGSAPPEPPLLDRVSMLTERFQRQAARYQRWGGTEWPIAPRSLFTVNLLSDAILFEQGWLPTQQLSADLLEELTGIRAKLVRAFSRPHTTSGWARLWQQPKPSVLAVGMGSLYLFQAEQPLTEAEAARLEQLQLDGVGERRQEGYGQVRICDTFHLLPEANETKEGAA